MRFLSGFDRFLMALMILFALLTFAGIVAGLVTPNEHFSPFLKHTLEWLADTSADFANTWAIILVAMGADRFAVMELQRTKQRECLEMQGKLELLFYPLRLPVFAPETGLVRDGFFPRKNFEKLLELRPVFQALFPKNDLLNRLIEKFETADKKAQNLENAQRLESSEIIFQDETIGEITEKLLTLS